MEHIYRLRLRGALHVGRGSLGLEGSLPYMPSDTLFSALVTTWAQMVTEAEIATWLAPFTQGQPPFLLTSAFPYAGDVRLYPAPAFPAPLSLAARRGAGKRFKRLSHVSEGILAGWLAGGSLESELQQTLPDGKPVANFVQGGRAWVTSDERRRIARALVLPADEPETLQLWRETTVPHVVVGRADNQANLYHTGRVHFAAQCGLWFAVQGADETWQARIGKALALMADSGMGGLRSRGHGAFACEEWAGALALPQPQPGDYAMVLSRVAPTAAQMAALLDEGARYRLAAVGGWCGSDQETQRKRRRVRLLAEGSTVRWTGERLGQMVDVNPTGGQGLAHPVYRYGYALAVGVAAQALEVRT